jgi:lysophospholipase L1-like esterase
VSWRRVVLTAAAGGALVLTLWATAWGAALPPWAHADPRAAPSLLVPRADPAPARGLTSRGLAGCEAGLERGQPGGGQRGGGQRVAIVGASFTAGVGPGNPGRSWAVVLARLLHWDAVIYGDPGAGYVRAGVGRKGPVAAEIARVDLRALAPALVIVQAGHDDIGVPLSLERRRVEQAVALIHAEAPHARIALLTVFAGRSPSAAAYRTDHAIVTAGRAADRNVIIIDPLAAGWTFPRSRDGLHPTASGSAWIAGQVAGSLREHGVRPAAPQPDKAGAIICDWSIKTSQG